MLAEIGQNIEKCKSILQSDGLVAIPTETVYGLAANGLNQTAVAKIFEAKNRPFFDPLILHIGKISQLDQITSYVPENANQLMQEFWPGPLTFIFKKSHLVPDLVTAGHQTVAVRLPNHPVALALLQQLDFPLAAPSANPFGYVSPTCSQHVFDQLGQKIPYILEGGKCAVGIESTIISFEIETAPKILRLGMITKNDIEAVIGEVQCEISENSNPKAPGQLDQHYSPFCKLRSIDELNLQNSNLPHILFYSPVSASSFWLSHEKIDHHPIYLTQKNDLFEAASNLFSILRDFDRNRIHEAFVQMAPFDGIGMAINDRLKRAMAKRP